MKDLQSFSIEYKIRNNELSGKFDTYGVGLNPKVRVRKYSHFTLFILGCPIVNDKRCDNEVVKYFENSFNETNLACLKEINGTFLILRYSDDNNNLVVINDRFASINFFYSFNNPIFMGSIFLMDLIKRRSELGYSFKINRDAVYELVTFRRLFGNDTLDLSCYFLPSASILKISEEEQVVKIIKYWRPNYDNKITNKYELIDRLSSSLKNSLKLYTSDLKDNGYGLFLSGGLDARAILAASNSLKIGPPNCYVTCMRENNESNIAKVLANTIGANFKFIVRPNDYYNDYFNHSVRLTNGMHSFVECQFLNYKNKICDTNKFYMTGLILDILFGGLYLPKTPVYYFGKKCLHYKLNKPNKQFADYFIQNVSYRLKTIEPYIILSKKNYDTYYERLKQKLTNIKNEAEDLGGDFYQQWEYMHHHNLSRHYSFPMLTSIQTWAECRTPALENSLFDLSLAMNNEEKVNSAVYVKALSKINKNLMNIRNANTNLAAQFDFKKQTYIKIYRKILNKVFKMNYPMSPHNKDRSWPILRDSLNYSTNIIKETRLIENSSTLRSLDIFDNKNISLMMNDYLTGKVDHSSTVAILLTIKNFLDQVSKY